ncbi:hypothetical protein KHC23_20720 [Ancylobacter dichloromethanicus]|uniref:hypothetical protein n=1 Tax=Ancylobacter dichloromethanicus TaxID=518825 RepID=UPI001BCC3110|nr:hypothetical protein [Ancylobacter dichloromethanicus]MBS7556059.1 hypothetical protein [Ancylobacter dichloromethanicus]
MSTTSADQTKTTSEHSVPNASSCCDGHAGAEAAEKANAHGSCGNHENAAAPDTVAPAGELDKPVSSAGHHPKKTGCCGGS